MNLHTGTGAFGATQTKSKSLASAILIAVAVSCSPNETPSSVITNTLSAVMFSLTSASLLRSTTLLILFHLHKYLIYPREKIKVSANSTHLKIAYVKNLFYSDIYTYQQDQSGEKRALPLSTWLNSISIIL